MARSVRKLEIKNRDICGQLTIGWLKICGTDVCEQEKRYFEENKCGGYIKGADERARLLVIPRLRCLIIFFSIQ